MLHGTVYYTVCSRIAQHCAAALLHGRAYTHHPLLLHLCVQLVQEEEVDANCERRF